MSGEEKKEEDQSKNSHVPRLPPPPATVTPPPAPKVKPDRKQALETIIYDLSNEELRYVWQLVKDATTQRVAEESEPIDPVLQPILDDISKAEEYMTKGFNVPYPPKALIPIDKGKDFGAEEILDLILDRLDPMLKNEKVQDSVARLIGAIADKIESGGK